MKTKALLVATLASAMAMPALVGAAEKKADTKEETVHCYGINKCKGVGDCAGKGHSCEGQNSCKGQGFLAMSKDLCLKIEGGRLTENDQKK